MHKHSSNYVQNQSEGLVAPGGDGDLGAFWYVVGLTCKIPWPEFEYGGYSVTFWIKRVGLE